ncbi:hypothetical protein AMK59_4625 [Oryctes borbonicus]|uniref:Serpin domain-containing protein n=1 Tax=Oryctes borbonicus TaxID=1629725 RepID=A0A0T6B689_9SCAR|nr:hypothetical protein AMK59_4625 [Oryctes borbonicus]
MANAVCNAISDLSYKLYSVISKRDGNYLYSPFSLHAILSMIHHGSTGGAAESLEKVLGITGTKKAAAGYESLLEAISFLYSVKLYVVTKVFAQGAIQDDFSALATKSFFAEAESINLSNTEEAAATINSWTDAKTESRIKDIVSASELTGSNLVLVNTVNLKGDWLIQFEEKDTKKTKFYISETETVDCQMLHSSERVKYGEDLDLESQVVCVAYENESIYLMVFLPRDRMGIKSLEEKIQLKTIPKILQNMDLADVLLYLPKFNIESKIDLQAPLKELGLGPVFDNPEFPSVVDGAIKGVKLVQKASFGVTEQGTDVGEAAIRNHFVILEWLPRGGGKK